MEPTIAGGQGEGTRAPGLFETLEGRPGNDLFLTMAERLTDKDVYGEIPERAGEWFAERGLMRFLELPARHVTQGELAGEVCRRCPAPGRNMPECEACLTALDCLGREKRGWSDWLTIYATWHCQAWARWFHSYDYTYIERHFLAAASLAKWLRERTADVEEKRFLECLERTSRGENLFAWMENALANQSKWEMRSRARLAAEQWSQVVAGCDALCHGGALAGHERVLRVAEQMRKLAVCHAVRAGLKGRQAALLESVPGLTGEAAGAGAQLEREARALLADMSEQIDVLEDQLEDAEGASNIRGHRGTLAGLLAIPADRRSGMIRVKAPAIQAAVHFFVQPEGHIGKYVFPREKDEEVRAALEREFLAGLRDALARRGIPVPGEGEFILGDEDPEDVWETAVANRHFRVKSVGLRAFRIVEGSHVEDPAAPRREHRFGMKVELTSLGTCSVRFELEQAGGTWRSPGEIRRVMSLLTPLAAQNGIEWEGEEEEAPTVPSVFRYVVRHKGMEAGEERSAEEANLASGEVLCNAVVGAVCEALHARMLHPGGEADEEAGAAREEDQPAAFFQPHSSWFVWAVADEMKDEGGRLLSYAGMKGSPWFKAFSIPLREARSSFDDWVCVPATHAPENLAHIKSHEAEFVFVDSNRAILYLPDTPDFLVNQYEATLLESSRLITLMAAIDAFAFRTAARSRSKMQRYTREGAQDDDGDDGGFLEFRMTVLEQQARLRDILQLAETVKSAAFADHARYMASALGAMGVGGVADRNREVLALLQSQLEGWSALTSEMDERSEARRERLMNLVLAFLAVFGSAQTYSAIWGNPWLEIGSADPATWSWVLGALVSAGSLMLFLLLYPRAIPKVVGRVRKRMARRRDSAGETGAARGDG